MHAEHTEGTAKQHILYIYFQCMIFDISMDEYRMMYIV